MHLKNPEKKNDLTIMKDHDLLTHFSWVVQKEREATVTVICYLSEIERRKLYLKEAYSSLFSFVTQKFHYSEGAAYRRIQASKVSQLYPQVLELLSRGKVSLMTLSLIEPHLTKENAKSWIERIIGKSKREVEFMLSELSLKKESHKDVIRRLPIFSTKRESLEKVGIERQQKLSVAAGEPQQGNNGQEKRADISKNVGQFLLPSAQLESAQNHTTTSESADKKNATFTGESAGETSVESAQKASYPMKEEVRKIKIEFVAAEGLAKKIERAKEVLRHKFPQGRFEDIFDQALEDMLEKRDPQRKIERMNQKSEKASEKGENKSTKQVESEKESKPERPEKKEESAVKGEKPSSSRYIAQAVKTAIWERDGGRCSYESADGRRCGERNFIQMDHVQPWALQGESTEENLRLFCAQHNQWRSEKTFGRWG